MWSNGDDLMGIGGKKKMGGIADLPRFSTRLPSKAFSTHSNPKTLILCSRLAHGKKLHLFVCLFVSDRRK